MGQAQQQQSEQQAEQEADHVQTYLDSRICLEEPEPDNAFAARAVFCHGYDVYGELLGRAGWAEMTYLLFRGEAPEPWQAAMLELLAVALANPGPRDPSVNAAMCGGVSGSVGAASLMAALAVGGGSFGGGHELALAMTAFDACGSDLRAWRARLANPPAEPTSAWPDCEHPPGFDPHGVSTTTPVKQTLARLAEAAGPASRTAWLQSRRAELEEAARHPLALTGVAAAALADLGFFPAEGEMLFLLLRLPGAAAHALEQAGYGHKRFPFYALELEDGPTEKRR
jgi:citrate synthase